MHVNQHPHTGSKTTQPLAALRRLEHLHGSKSVVDTDLDEQLKSPTASLRDRREVFPHKETTAVL